MKSCCSMHNSSVIDSRVTDKGLKIRRRRKCKTCLARWTTFEELKKEDHEVFVLGKCPLCNSEAKLVNDFLIICTKCNLTLNNLSKHALIKIWNARIS